MNKDDDFPSQDKPYYDGYTAEDETTIVQRSGAIQSNIDKALIDSISVTVSELNAKLKRLEFQGKALVDYMIKETKEQNNK